MKLWFGILASENKKIPIYIHETGVKKCDGRSKIPFYRQFSWGKSKPFQAIALREIYESAKCTWEVIHTPGHEDDYIALYNREKGWMFGGYLYILRYPKSMFAFESVPVIIESLKRISMYVLMLALYKN